MLVNELGEKCVFVCFVLDGRVCWTVCWEMSVVARSNVEKCVLSGEESFRNS